VPTHSRGRQGRSVAVLATSALVAAPLAVSLPASAQTGSDGGGSQTYIVQLADAPLASYDGGTNGIPGTKPGVGEKVDVDSTAADRYTDYLAAQRSEVLQEAGADTEAIVTTYEVALNGFAATLTASQVAELRKSADVLNVWENEIRELDTVSTPDYLGMTGEDGVWQTQFGGPADAGEGVVVGVLDSGIDAQNPSFASLGGTPDPDFEGVCDTGGDPEFACNDKVIGARFYDAAFGNTIHPSEFLSPRDRDGHGSHTAGTAAGNYDVPMSIRGTDLGAGSGMAPAAQIAAYKVCWYDEGCASAGLVAAIDDAVADGVDVINYSISGSSAFVVTAEELAFLGAADAGVFVSTSAGNSGDTVGRSSVAHNAPWTTTVAASTHDRGAGKTVTLGDGGDSYEGVGVGEAVGPAPLVDSSDVGLPGVSQTAVDECWWDADPSTPGVQPTLDPALVDGTIVLCDRGTVARTDKSEAVALAGGIGMVQANTSQAQSLNADFHAVPSIHVDSIAGAAVEAYIAATADPTATISAQSTDPVVAPEMAGFSSYGPALAGGGDLLKPDITAPGVDVVAAYHENLTTGDAEFNSISGTSMSAPHIAGLGALLMGKNPGWSPMAVKSAMMTTAGVLDTAGGPIQRSGVDATPLDFGAGEVVPADSYNPGLVYDSDIIDWYAYTCAINQLQLLGGGQAVCDNPAVPDIDPSDLNSPSIAIGDLAGVQTVTRTVTNVSGAEATFTAQVEAPAGLDVTVSPEALTVPAGGEATYEVTVQQVDAPVNAYTFGSLTWVSGETEVRSPLAIQPVALAAPDEIFGEGISGTESYEIVAGVSGELVHDVDGLVASDVDPVEVVRDPSTTADATSTIEVGDDVKTLRIATYDSEVTAADIDLFVVDPSGDEVAFSAGTSAEETVTLEDPAPGTWTVEIDLWSAEPTATVPVHAFLLTEEDTGTMTVDPESATVQPGDEATVTVDWAGLEQQSRYLGAVNYTVGGETLDRTLVSIVTGEPDPTVTRIGGDDRYETAALISELYPDEVDTVFIASGQAFADALSGSASATGGVAATMGDVGTTESGAVGAPILLTRVGSLPAVTVEALEAINPSEIVILGGETVVSPAVEEALGDHADDVVRIGGDDRFHTSALIAMAYGVGSDTVYLASGHDDSFADALSGGALGGAQGAPVLLTRPDRVAAATAEALDFLDADNVVVLGGPAAVSQDVYDAVGATGRLAGDNRWETSAAIAGEFPADLPATHVASGLDWPDALAGGANAGFLGVPLVLSKPTDVPDVVMAELDRLSPAFVGVLGGTTALSQDVEDELNASFPAWAAE
jgi:putative cell wall-binding protein/subtilisin family serine protease